MTEVGFGLRIADLPLRLDIPDRALAAALASAWAPFAASEDPYCVVEIELAPGRPSPQPKELPAVAVQSDGSLEIVGENFEARVSADRTVARIRQRADRYPVDAVVKVLLADFLLGRGGLLLHSAGVATATGAGVFVGDSGAGKSTLSSWSQKGGLTMLSDELVAVAKTGEEYVACGTPWNTGHPKRAPLRIIGALAWGEHRLEPMNRAQLLRVLLPNALMPDPSAAGRARMFKAASALLQAVAPMRLTFRPDPGVAATLREVLDDDRLA